MIDMALELRKALQDAHSDLDALVRRAVREEVAALHTGGHPDDLLDAEVTARLIGMSPAALRRAAERGRFPVPPVRIGRRLRWRRADLHQLLVNRQDAKASTNRQKKASSRARGAEGAPSQPNRGRASNQDPPRSQDGEVT